VLQTQKEELAKLEWPVSMRLEFMSLEKECQKTLHRTSSISWDKPPMLKENLHSKGQKVVFKFFSPIRFTPMVDIINLNPISSYKVDFCCTFLF